MSSCRATNAKPFDAAFMNAMNRVAIALCEEAQGAMMAYVQSDEVSVLVHGYKRFASSPWFDNQVQKIASIGASIASSSMTASSIGLFGSIKPARFDARVFVVPENDVANYFLWRQRDATRNALQMLARSLYSHARCAARTSPARTSAMRTSAVRTSALRASTTRTSAAR